MEVDPDIKMSSLYHTPRKLPQGVRDLFGIIQMAWVSLGTLVSQFSSSLLSLSIWW